MSSSVSFWTTSRERGPITPRCGIDGVIHSNSASRPCHSLPEVLVVVPAVGHHPAVVLLRGVEHGPVVHHQPVGIEERAVAHLPDLEPERVVAERPLGGPQRVGSAELPLVQRRDVPHRHVVADRGVLLRDVAEPLEPHPPAVLDVRTALRGGHLVERGPDRFVLAHRASGSTKPHPPTGLNGRSSARQVSCARASLASRRALLASPLASRRTSAAARRARQATPGLPSVSHGGEEEAAEHRDVLEEVDPLLGLLLRGPAPPRSGGRPRWSAPAWRRARRPRAGGSGRWPAAAPRRPGRRR